MTHVDKICPFCGNIMQFGKHEETKKIDYYGYVLKRYYLCIGCGHIELEKESKED